MFHIIRSKARTMWVRGVETTQRQWMQTAQKDQARDRSFFHFPERFMH